MYLTIIWGSWSDGDAVENAYIYTKQAKVGNVAVGGWRRIHKEVKMFLKRVKNLLTCVNRLKTLTNKIRN